MGFLVHQVHDEAFRLRHAPSGAWLRGRGSNPDKQIQSLLSYH